MSVGALFFGSVCVVCGAPGPSPCGGCARRLRRAPPFAAPAGLDSCAALLAYDGAGRDLVAGLKYRNRRVGVARLAAAMVAAAEVAWGGTVPVDVVTWAPTTSARRRARGYDQARLLAGEVARQLHRPLPALLSRRPGPPQTGRPLVERRGGARFAPRRAASGRVLLVDDVLTTGATIEAAAEALRGAGAREVHGLVLARTPLKAPPVRAEYLG